MKKSDLGDKMIFMKKYLWVYIMSTVAFSAFSGVPVMKKNELRLPAVIASNMVLQRDTSVPIWGYARPGITVSVKFAGQLKTVTAGKDGRWRVELAPLPASNVPHEMLISCGDNTKKLTNILIGEVWLCSGQSNMMWPVNQAANSKQEIAAADHPEIRLFQVERIPAGIPLSTCGGSWQACSPSTVGNFSAVAYYFGRELSKRYKIPIGLIDSSYGGTKIEAWTRREAFAGDKSYQDILEAYDKTDPDIKNVPPWQFDKAAKIWKTYKPYQDIDDRNTDKDWEKADFLDSRWQEMDLPDTWENHGLFIDGVVWFRKKIEIPAGWSGRELTLDIGYIDDTDIVYMNGVEVGSTDTSIPSFWVHHRIYKIPGRLVKPGISVLAVRVFDQWGKGGIYEGNLQLHPTSVPNDTINLSGNWKYKVARALAPKLYIHSPCGMFNGMISPLIPFAIRGVIWYQGESNARHAGRHTELFKLLIRDWRKCWNNKKMPFLFVQLANFIDPNPKHDWPLLRETQLQALEEPETAMAVTIDIGEADNIHPRNKQEVGRRLALAARKVAYGENIEYSGPQFSRITVKADEAILDFTHAAGLKAVGGKLDNFELAGDDRIFHRAVAKITGNRVIVSSLEVKHPVAVRYGWHCNPKKCNLFNKENLPASPFRSKK